jgi:hypothetical protein
MNVPAELFNIKNPSPLSDEKRIPIAKILAAHRERWDFVCSLGTMRLKRMTLLDQEATIIRLEQEHPEYFEMSKQARELWHLADKGAALSPEQSGQLSALVVKIQPFAHEFSARCFEDPALNDGSELSHLLFELQPEEREKLLGVLAKLANPSPNGKVETVGLSLAKEFGLKLAEDLTVENMTAQQATVLTRQLVESRGGE